MILLPYPPSINHYWRRVGHRTLISREGRAFRKNVCSLLGGVDTQCHLSDQRIALMLSVYPPDRRRRDLDNIQKPVLDALEHAGVYSDDGQVDLLITQRGEVVKGGKLLVEVMPMPLRQCPLCHGVI